ncbi:MAG TPA: non-ribosomal peptide synthetase, partial [Thermoanaerobaculia bacterium]
AVCQWDRSWTYAGLAASARGLSGLVRRSETVAVSGPPSFGLVTAMLAVLRGGGVLLTLDSALPPARLRLMAREAGVRLLLWIGKEGEEGLTELPEVETVLVDPATGRAPGVELPADPPLPGPDDPAYVFFTSGSTGVPKGVLGCHKGIGHFLAWQRETFAVGPGDRCAQLTSLSFDALLRDVFLPLTSGAALCLPEEAGLPPARLVPWLAREGITLLHTLPAVAQVWAGSREEPLPLPALRRVFFSGEPLTGALVGRWRRAFPGGAVLVNLYGPTETTMTKCFFVVPAEPAPGIQPLGWPLPATQALVLGTDDLPCGMGEAGEIVLRTPFRTLGYLNAPEEMAQRFVPNPHLDDPGDLLYRTGDCGRYRPDGSLEILGRLDDQVKVRGVRVEPGEIEAALLHHPAVAAAAVVAREDRGGERRLIAYVEPANAADGKNPAAGDLRAFLRQELPEPILPAAFIVLDRLPLTPTGKVDRRALPDPEAAPPVPAATAEPRTPLERAVAEIWQEVLQLDRVGLDENFFDLGGHSLRLLEVHSRLSALAGSELPLMELFRHPTVSALARFLEEHRADRDKAPHPVLAAAPTPQAGSRAVAIVG